MPHRYRALDTYRFIAAAGIVFYHFENHFQPFLPAPTHALERCQLFVDFFFVLSGFVMACTYGDRIKTASDFSTFLRKRLARIYPLHLATIVLFCACGAAVVALNIPVRDRSFFDVSLLPANLLLVHAWGVTDHPGLNVPSWSISAEWFVYLLFPVLVATVRHAGAVLALCVAFAIAFAIDRARAWIGLGPGDVATVDFGNLRALPSFIAGIAIFKLLDRPRLPRVPWPLAHTLAVMVLALMLAHAPSWVIVCSFPVLVAALAAAERNNPRSLFTSRTGVLLGDASFAIYMIHTFFQVAAVIVARKLGWTSAPALLALSLGTFGVIVLAGLASYRWFEDPLRRRIVQRRAADRAVMPVEPAR